MKRNQWKQENIRLGTHGEDYGSWMSNPVFYIIGGIGVLAAVYNYSKALCEKNAASEGVASRCVFQHGDAKQLDFPDESFDVVISNYVYHNVMGADMQKLRDMGYEEVRLVDTAQEAFGSRRRAAMMMLGSSRLLVGRK